MDYEIFVDQPAGFLEQVVKDIGVTTRYNHQSNNAFYVDPTMLHIVAGNPMRYKGRQLVKHDKRWETELAEDELARLHGLKLN